MTFVTSKLFWAVIVPGNLLLLLLLLALVAMALSRRRRGFGLAVVVGLALLVVAVLPVGEWLVAPLENRFPVPALPARVDGIVVLGGAVEPAISRAHGQVALNDAAERITETAVLAHRYPQARIVASGGNAAILPRPHEEEAGLMRAELVALGVAGDRVLVEDRSRNTYENATLSRDLAHPQPGETWLLVTSAWHMPRAVGCFRQIGWDVLPYPVDYRTEARPRLEFLLDGHLALLDLAAKEWVGLAAYRLLGRTDALFPAPQPFSASNAR
jgi:uncharacterized SAM-binding protein YcdF (DUF218 family)